MSGHSKWETTKRQKAVVDAKRGALFTKIGNQIAIAARAGQDPAMNPSLAMVLEKARHANMPKANIERAIARAADKNAAAMIEETYEAYYNLAAAFGATADDATTTDKKENEISFTEGWQNNLTLIINPDKIEFDAKVSEWDDRDFEYSITEP